MTPPITISCRLGDLINESQPPLPQLAAGATTGPASGSSIVSARSRDWHQAAPLMA